MTVIEEYIAAQPEKLRPTLNKLRRTILKAAPEAAEIISWNMPTFRQGVNLIHFAVFKKHIGIFPGDLSQVPFKDRLTGYKTTKGGIQFPIGKPIDFELIAEITKWRVLCADKSGAVKSRAVKSRTVKSGAGTGRMTRQVHEIPDYITAALDRGNLWDLYNARPPYQRNDYIGWITRGKREETRQKRLNQMLEELRNGNAYMGMKYLPKNKE
ncbi:MAG: YdeI/OmpD-associated family protein [Treponema sp.]|nr:YdeI/OmpD-associated family protein [Treponema sp.]